MCSFQLTNALALIKNITAKYNNAKGEIQKAYKIIQDQKKESQKLRTMLKVDISQYFKGFYWKVYFIIGIDEKWNGI